MTRNPAKAKIYIKRLQKLRAAIKLVPLHLVEMWDTGISTERKILEHGPDFTTKDVIACGTPGCLLGWSRTIPEVRNYMIDRNLGVD